MKSACRLHYQKCGSAKVFKLMEPHVLAFPWHNLSSHYPEIAFQSRSIHSPPPGQAHHLSLLSEVISSRSLRVEHVSLCHLSHCGPTRRLCRPRLSGSEADPCTVPCRGCPRSGEARLLHFLRVGWVLAGQCEQGELRNHCLVGAERPKWRDAGLDGSRGWNICK